MQWYVFRFNNNCYRYERAQTVQDACILAFGTVYGPSSEVKYKCIGKKSLKTRTNTEKKEIHSDRDWQNMPERKVL